MSTRGVTTVRRIVIVGDGVTGRLATAVLASRLPRDLYAVDLVEDVGEGADGADAEFGPAIATMPSLAGLHHAIGLDEDVLVRRTGATFSLGAAFVGWNGEGVAAFLPFGLVGAPLDGVAFHQLAARMRRAGRDVRLVDYALAALAAQAGRFTRPSNDQRSPTSQIVYGLHIDTAAYRAVLRDVAEARGAVWRQAPLTGLTRRADGAVEALRLADGSVVEPWLVLDCTGSRRAAAKGVFDSWSRWLPFGRSAGVMLREGGGVLPYAIREAKRFGWQETIPFSGGVAKTMHWSRTQDDEEALALLPVAARKVMVHEAGALSEPWRDNVVALGGAAAVIEPLHPVGLQLVQSALTRLITLFPAGDTFGAERREYNRLMTAEALRTRDFVAAHHHLNARTGERVWDDLRETDAPPELAAKLALFAARGRIVMHDGDVFEEDDWVTLLDTQGMRPRRADAVAQAVPIARIEAHLARLRSMMIETVREMPTHDAFLRGIAQAPVRRSAA